MTIKTAHDLLLWLYHKPALISAAIANRIALRTLSFTPTYGVIGLPDQFFVQVFRALAISSVLPRIPPVELGRTANQFGSSASAAIGSANTVADLTSVSSAAFSVASAAADSAESALRAAKGAGFVQKQSNENASAIALKVASENAAAADSAASTAIRYVHVSSKSAAHSDFEAVDGDCDWLVRKSESAPPEVLATDLLGTPLWPLGLSEQVKLAQLDLELYLESLHSDFELWIDWYQRRIEGHATGFALPPDADLELHRRLIAQDDNWWKRNPGDVNREIRGWIEELTPPELDSVPPLRHGGITYGLDEKDRVARAPMPGQDQLNDVPDQRERYQDIRETAAELARYGQQLGGPLQAGIDRLLNAMPAEFEQALAYRVWRELQRLFALMRKHEIAVASGEYSHELIDATCAVDFGVLLQLADVFKLGDSPLQNYDRAGGQHQLGHSAKVEAEAGTVLANEALQVPEMATDEAQQDLAEDTEAVKNTGDGPFDPPLVEAVNANRANWFSRVLLSARNFAVRQSGQTSKAVREGAEREAGAQAFQFVLRNREQFMTYARQAYRNFDLGRFIDSLTSWMN